MRIEQIEIRNYRVFRDVKLTRLPPMTVIIGANGTGKSTLFENPRRWLAFEPTSGRCARHPDFP